MFYLVSERKSWKQYKKFMKKFFGEFREFALRGNVMDLAVGVIIGAAFQSIVNSLVNDVISPLIGIVAKMDLSYLYFKINDVEIRYGAFLTSIINFVIMVFLIFLLIKAMNKLASIGKKPVEAKKPTTKKCPFCKTDIDINAIKCPHCTSDIK